VDSVDHVDAADDGIVVAGKDKAVGIPLAFGDLHAHPTRVQGVALDVIEEPVTEVVSRFLALLGVLEYREVLADSRLINKLGGVTKVAHECLLQSVGEHDPIVLT